jgi:hypothetical protein
MDWLQQFLKRIEKNFRGPCSALQWEEKYFEDFENFSRVNEAFGRLQLGCSSSNAPNTPPTAHEGMSRRNTGFFLSGNGFKLHLTTVIKQR